MFIRLLPVVATLAVLGGCAIRPLPRDVTEYDTFDIVRKVRCDMRRAILLERRPAWYGSHGSNTLDRLFVGYEFTFDIREDNDLQAGLTVLQPFSRGPLKLGLSAQERLRRRNARNFRMIDSGITLARLSPDYCSLDSHSRKWMYPITGSIGLSESVRTYLELTAASRLLGSSERPEMPTFADKIEFTTELKASANPSIELDTVGSGTQIGSGTIGLGGSRKDIHRLVLVLTTLPEGKKDGSDAQKMAEKQIIDELKRQQDRSLSANLSDVVNGS
ncbi:hypothetical protein [Jiella sp. M17.18]|uniref:hypothetical protein n=1 Tax=Jiella sp. M17.18 TaxID=3234247 RepID=UPI0034E03F42